MMKAFSLLAVLSSATCAKGSVSATFGASQPPLFGIRAGASNELEPKDDYERAEQAIFNGMGQVEARLQKAIEEEVHAIFDADDDHVMKNRVADHAKTAVTKGADKIKGYYKAQQEPLWPKQDEKDMERNDHRLLHAIEAAEKAMLQAVQEEVETLFHETHDEHHPLKDESPKSAKQAKESVKRGVRKAKKHVEDSHEVRKGWMEQQDTGAIEEYMKSVSSVYGMGY